jgi:hypothetical protein
MTNPDTNNLPVDCPDCTLGIINIMDFNLSTDCPTCGGSGMIDSETAAKLAREARLQFLEDHCDD